MKKARTTQRTRKKEGGISFVSLMAVVVVVVLLPYSLFVLRHREEALQGHHPVLAGAHVRGAPAPALPEGGTAAGDELVHTGEFYDAIQR